MAHAYTIRTCERHRIELAALGEVSLRNESYLVSSDRGLMISTRGKKQNQHYLLKKAARLMMKRTHVLRRIQVYR